jgi:hypothetical protein
LGSPGLLDRSTGVGATRSSPEALPAMSHVRYGYPSKLMGRLPTWKEI